MIDPRMTRLAEVLVNYSTALKPGEKILIEAIDVPVEMTCELVRVARAAGGEPLVTLKSNRVNRALMLHGSQEQMDLIAQTEALRMSNVAAYIGLRGSLNIAEQSDLPDEKHKLYQTTVWQKVHLDIRIPKTRWVVLRWPSPSMAQLANRSTEAFEDFYFNVCTLDYAKLGRAMKPRVERMNATDQVRIVGPGTELTFSIKGLGAIACDGKLNIPDGEVFTAPVRDSVNGVLQCNARTIYQGVVHDNVRLEFREGKIVAAASTNTEHLNKVLDSMTGPGTSANSPWGSIPTLPSRSWTFCSTKRSPARSTSRRAAPTRRPTTAIRARSTGTWYASRTTPTAAGRSILTVNWCERTGDSSCQSWRR